MRHDRLYTKLQEAYEHILKEEQKPNFDALCESILLDEGVLTLAKKGFKMLGKSVKGIAKGLIKNWKPLLVATLAIGAYYAIQASGGDVSGVDVSSQIDILNSLFSQTTVDHQTATNLLSNLIEVLHSGNVPVEEAQQIVSQVEAFRGVDVSGIYGARDAASAAGLL